MIAFVRGILFSSENNKVVLDVHGIGYDIGISLSTFAKLPSLNEELFLYTYHHITDSTQSLFGFSTEDERSLFVSLIGINKVGPKVAINILSGMSVERLVMSVENQDVAAFKSVSGVGPKTAQRLVLELKGKLNVSVDLTSTSTDGTQRDSAVEQQVADEAYTALIALGYSDAQIRPVLARVAESVTDQTPVHEWITTALKLL